jgi:hypothetical protein
MATRRRSWANRILGSHELFHAVQSAYDVEQGSVLAEGTAVWATEQFDPSLDDLEWFITGFFENVDRPLDEPLPGPADPYSYGAGVFFQFLHEALGPTVVRSLWERCEDGAGGVDDPYWLDVLDATLQDAADISFSRTRTSSSRRGTSARTTSPTRRRRTPRGTNTPAFESTPRPRPIATISCGCTRPRPNIMG